jgi:hypothetical protein
VDRAAVVLGVANIFYGVLLANERQERSYVYGVVARGAGIGWERQRGEMREHLAGQKNYK